MGGNMIIDAGGYLGNYPYRKLSISSAGSLGESASALGVTHMVVSSIDAVFYKDASQGNDMLIEMLKEKAAVTFIPFCVVNPTYPGWREDAERAILKQCFKGFELCPGYHRYKLNDDYGCKVLSLAEKLNVPVRVSNGFEDRLQRSHMDIFEESSPEELIDAVKRFPSVKFLLIGFMSNDLAWRIDNNAYLDFSRLDVFEGIINTMKGLLCSPKISSFLNNRFLVRHNKLYHRNLDLGKSVLDAVSLQRSCRSFA